jgi:dynein heavy chain
MFEVKPVKVAAADGKGKEDNYWEAAKKELLVDPRLLERMMNYDKDNIPDAVITKVMPLYNDPEFDPERIKKASLAAMGICKWVRAMVVYNGVAKEVDLRRQSWRQPSRRSPRLRRPSRESKQSLRQSWKWSPVWKRNWPRPTRKPRSCRQTRKIVQRSWPELKN